jgi:hypothetical protein
MDKAGRWAVKRLRGRKSEKNIVDHISFFFGKKCYNFRFFYYKINMFEEIHLDFIRVSRYIK